MNFFGHAFVATRGGTKLGAAGSGEASVRGGPRRSFRGREPDPARVLGSWVLGSWVLGAMLPDFASMAGARLLSVSDPHVAAGVAFHHRTDEVFHRAPTFLRFCVDGARELEAVGVGRGAARAVAHVGTELLLDGWLLGHPRGARAAEAYRRALGLEVDALGLRFSAGGEARFADLLERLRAHGLPLAYRDPGEVALRLERILSRRPRLALQPDERAPVRRWLERTHPHLETYGPRLLREVLDGLGLAAADAGADDPLPAAPFAGRVG